MKQTLDKLFFCFSRGTPLLLNFNKLWPGCVITTQIFYKTKRFLAKILWTLIVSFVPLYSLWRSSSHCVGDEQAVLGKKEPFNTTIVNTLLRVVGYMFRPITKTIRGDVRSDTYSPIYAPDAQRNSCGFSCNTVVRDSPILIANTVARHLVTVGFLHEYIRDDGLNSFIVWSVGMRTRLKWDEKRSVKSWTNMGDINFKCQ
jgi:hypothetical protein